MGHRWFPPPVAAPPSKSEIEERAKAAAKKRGGTEKLRDLSDKNWTRMMGIEALHKNQAERHATTFGGGVSPYTGELDYSKGIFARDLLKGTLQQRIR